jgi:hypothetical protein
MKYLASFLALPLLLAALPSQAQDPNGFRLGLKAGATYANGVGGGVDKIAGPTSSSSREKNLFGYSAGLTFSIPVFDGTVLAVAPEVLVAQRGYHITTSVPTTSGRPNDVYDTQRRLTYLDVPVLAHIRAGGVFFELGPQFSYLLSAKADSRVTSTSTSGQKTENDIDEFPGFDGVSRAAATKSDLNPFDLSAVGGIGYQTNSGLSLTLRYARGFRTIIDGSSENHPKVYNTSLTLQVGYSLPVGSN